MSTLFDACGSYEEAGDSRAIRDDMARSLSSFIHLHRAEIDKVILAVVPNLEKKRIDDHERRLWVLNHEPLYLWAKHHGCDI